MHDSNAKRLEEQQLSYQARFPLLYISLDNQIDRRSCKRITEMKVLALGMSRTGTVALQEALQQLGYNDTYHGISTFENPRDCVMWQQAIDAKFYGKGKPFERKEWDMLLGHCQAVCDLPAAAFMPELIVAYPDAKVILSYRPVDSWYKSALGTIDKAMNDPIFQFMRYIDPLFLGIWIPMFTDLWTALYGKGRNAFRENAKEVYRNQYDEVRALVSGDRLYERQIGDGWEGLCNFLGKDVPSTPFPKSNETEPFNEMVKVMKITAIGRLVRRLKGTVRTLLPLIIIGAGVWWYLNRANH